MRTQSLLLPVCVALLAACTTDPPAEYPPNRPAPPTGTTEGDQSVAVAADANTYADTDPSALTDFHPALDAHGTWVEDPTYGTVWVPAGEEVGSDFAPYNTHGHWAYDEENNYVWVSDYEWGWAPFHYGRWTYINGTGWGWTPGRTYAPAWVEWRDGGAANPYVGWAPSPPNYGWRGGVAVGLNNVPAPAYVYTGHANIFSPGIHDHLVPSDQVPGIASHTTPYGAPATSSTGGTRNFANPTVMRGPPPAQLGIAPSEVVHVTTTAGGARPGIAPSDVAHSGGTPGGAHPGATPGVAPSDVAHSGGTPGGTHPGATPGVAPTDIAHSGGTSGTPGNHGASPTDLAHSGGTAGASGVAQAQAFAHPNTAVAAGGHAPSAHTFRSPTAIQSHAEPTHYVAATAPHVGVRNGGVKHR